MYICTYNFIIQVDKLDSEQFKFAKNYAFQVGDFWIKACRKSDKMFDQHPQFFQTLLPEKSTKVYTSGQ